MIACAMGTFTLRSPSRTVIDRHASSRMMSFIRSSLSAGLRFLAPFGRLSGFPDWPGLKRDAAGGFAYQTSYLVGRIASALAGSFSYSSFIRPPPTSGWTAAIRRPRVPPHLAHKPPIAPGCGRNTSGQVCRGTRLALRPPVSYLLSRCASVQGIHVLLS